jgi:lysozyme
MMDAQTQIKGFEAPGGQPVLTAYPDPITRADPWTIGWGHTGPEVKPGLVWDADQCDFAFQLDFGHAWTFCSDHFAPWFAALLEPRQAVLIGMAFQMGPSRLLGFGPTLDLIRDERYATAADHIRQSLWAKQTPGRANRLAYQMESGAWQ